MFEHLSVYSCPVIVCGDFNVHVDDTSCVHAARLADLAFDYVQHVTTATHTAGHILDLVIARSDTDITDVHVGGFISDHALVRFTVRVRKAIKPLQISQLTFLENIQSGRVRIRPGCFRTLLKP